jgi:hypothetical protein
MSSKIARFISLFCAALVAGLTLAHDLEIPGKQKLSGAEWLQVQHTFYGGFAVVGGVAEVVGLVTSGILAYLLRKQLTAFIMALVATVCFLATLAMFAFGNNPLNQHIAHWTSATLPANWQQTRDAWDRFHAASSIFSLIALIVLLVAMLRDTAETSTVDKEGSALSRRS